MLINFLLVGTLPKEETLSLAEKGENVPAPTSVPWSGDEDGDPTCKARSESLVEPDAHTFDNKAFLTEPAAGGEPTTEPAASAGSESTEALSGTATKMSSDVSTTSVH